MLSNHILSIYSGGRGPIIIGPWGPWGGGGAEFDIRGDRFDSREATTIHGSGERKFPAAVDRGGLWRAGRLEKNENASGLRRAGCYSVTVLQSSRPPGLTVTL